MKVYIKTDTRNKQYFNIKTNIQITNKDEIDYINSLKIPPAWKDVIINLDRNTNILAIGKDSKNRTQAIYHKKKQLKRQKEYFCSLKNVVTKLPELYNDITNNLNKK